MPTGEYEGILQQQNSSAAFNDLFHMPGMCLFFFNLDEECDVGGDKYSSYVGSNTTFYCTFFSQPLTVPLMQDTVLRPIKEEHTNEKFSKSKVLLAVGGREELLNKTHAIIYTARVAVVPFTRREE